MIGYVYLTTNDINDIVYVGKRQKPYFDKKYKGSGKHLKLAFKKYGKDKFHSRIIERCGTVEDLCSAEKKWIAYYKTQGYKLYNIAEGGEGGYLGATWRDLPQDKAMEVLRKNKEAHLGEKNPFYGKHHTEHTKSILREKNKRKKIPIELKTYKDLQRSKLPKILQIDKTTNEVIKLWDNWCEASKEVSPRNRCGYGHIAQCCNHERKSAYGFKWEYAEVCDL